MENPKDFYSILGVPRDATTATIQRAYRRLARRFHPDTGHASSVEMYRDLQVAYETLSDAERRRLYDESLGRPEPGRAGPNDATWALLQAPVTRDLRRPLAAARTLDGDLVLNAAEATRGGVLPVDVPLAGACPVCRGTGGASLDCVACAGEGYLMQRLAMSLRVPPGVRSGSVFQIVVDQPVPLAVLLTVHVARA